MPDLLTHYSVSLLLASRRESLRRAAVIAVAGLLPDLDALLGVHRSPSHSLLLALAVLAALAIAARRRKSRTLRVAALAALLYALHAAMDALTAPTPILWPLTPQYYQLSVAVIARLGQGAPALTPRLAIIPAPGFTPPRTAPAISPSGAAVALATTLILAVERSRRGAS